MKHCQWQRFCPLRPWCIKCLRYGIGVCDVYFDVLDVLVLHDLLPGRWAKIQDSDGLRILASHQQVLNDPASNKPYDNMENKPTYEIDRR